MISHYYYSCSNWHFSVFYFWAKKPASYFCHHLTESSVVFCIFYVHYNAVHIFENYCLLFNTENIVKANCCQCCGSVNILLLQFEFITAAEYSIRYVKLSNYFKILKHLYMFFQLNSTPMIKKIKTSWFSALSKLNH